MARDQPQNPSESSVKVGVVSFNGRPMVRVATQIPINRLFMIPDEARRIAKAILRTASQIDGRVFLLEFEGDDIDVQRAGPSEVDG